MARYRPKSVKTTEKKIKTPCIGRTLHLWKIRTRSFHHQPTHFQQSLSGFFQTCCKRIKLSSYPFRAFATLRTEWNSHFCRVQSVQITSPTPVLFGWQRVKTLSDVTTNLSKQEIGDHRAPKTFSLFSSRMFEIGLCSTGHKPKVLEQG